ncbi:hypothetical protein [Burkholderia orbicola]|uniref:hypothetical protein n=1 Tax=Burkholderia orbicola TaxID=2978683 RepID=UPI00264CDA0E|nr:hypothetical protein [Burkholderia orbicola]MDN7556789.1 hypothetical protein [Burkholderia orbicola]
MPLADRASGVRAGRDRNIDRGRRCSDFRPGPRKLPRPAIRLALIAVLIAPLFAGCASTRSDTTATSGAARKPVPADRVPADRVPGEQVDYAGHRCGNPNLYVKTHPCVYPPRDSAP